MNDATQKPTPDADPLRHQRQLFNPHGGFRKLKVYRLTEVIYDLTVLFCDRWIPADSRTHDQMVQAARSGMQNLGEGSENAATSRKSEMYLTEIARGSLGELARDFETFLRQNNLREWQIGDPEFDEFRAMRLSTRDDIRAWINASGQGGPLEERAANALLMLTRQTHFLIGRLLAAQGRQFLENGGFTERLYRERTQFRDNSRTPTQPG